MSGFTDRFGGSVLQPADVALREVALAANQATFWPPFADASNVLARQMDVTPTAPGFIISLPDATLSTPGMNSVFRNLGASNFSVADFGGNVLVTVTPGQVVNLYVTDTSTQNGLWGLFYLGPGVSNLDLANAAGNGLLVASSRLAVSPIVSAVAGNRTIAAGDRATAFVWTGGVGTFTLPLSSALGQFFFEVRNQGTGALTIQTTGGELIDASATIALQLNESCFVHAGTGAWYTVGRGRSTQFAFTQLQKVVTGGTVTETLTEAANVVQTFTGALVSNVDIVVPAIVQVYYVSNQTSGAFNFRVKNPGAGTTVSIPSGQNAVLFSDGTNVINASTTIAGISSLVLAAGSASSPSLGVGAINSGLYSSGSNEVSVSANSAQVARFDPNGLTIVNTGGQIGVNVGTGNAAFNLTRPTGAYGVTNYFTGANQRWRVGVDNSTEAGSNAGSNYVFDRYTDAGALINTALALSRAQGSVASATLTDTGANGAGLKLTGDGVTTPSKTIRARAGIMEFMNNAYTSVASLTDAGTFTAVNVGISSDERLKNNIASTTWSAPFRLARLTGVSYTRGGKPECGLIAQRVNEVYPELVHKDQTYWSINYTGLIGELVNSQKLLWVAVAVLSAIELWRMFS